MISWQADKEESLIHQELIESLGSSADLRVAPAPSGKYARLERNGRTVAWAIPLGRCYAGPQHRWFSIDAEAEADALITRLTERGIPATKERVDIGGERRWRVNWIAPCTSSCDVRLDLRRNVSPEADEYLAGNPIASWRPLRRWVGGGNTQIRINGGQRDAAAELLTWVAGLPPAERRRQLTERLRLNRRFGVEIEFFGITMDAAKEALRGVGWHRHIKGDGSVNARGTGVGVGLELATPPLVGEQGLQQLKVALDSLKAAGAKIDKSCGLHVHLDAAGNTKAIKRLVRSWTRNRGLIELMVPPSRRRTNYARPWTIQQIARLEERGVRGMGGRYHDINVTAYARHGTVEFRLHSGTVEYEKVEAWLLFCMAMFDEAHTRGEELDRQGSLASLFARLDLPNRTKEFLLSRAARGFRGDRPRQEEVYG